MEKIFNSFGNGINPDENIKGLELFWNLFNNNEQFRRIVLNNWDNGKIRFFGDSEWKKIDSQNFISLIPGVQSFRDIFTMGYNIGDCVGVSWQLSYSYNDVDVVAGILPLLKGTLNAEKEGGHRWLEDDTSIIDTSLMLVIDKSLKKDIGYIEEQRLTSSSLSKMPLYQARKDFTNDQNLKKK